MRLYIALLALGLSLSCSVSPPRPDITGPVKLVQFTDGWIKWKNGAAVGVNDNVQYVVRKSKDSKLLFAVKQGFDGTLFGKEVSDFPVTRPNYDYYSDTRVALSIQDPGQVKEVTEEEWDAGDKVLHSYHFILNYDPEVTAEGVKYNDHLCRKSGESWGTAAALISPRKTRIGIFSYTSREKVSKSIVPGQGTEPGSGEVFLDIYDLSSGEKVGSAHTAFGHKPNGFAPSMLFSASVWIEDRFIIMPLDPELTRGLVGVFPDK